MVPFQWIY